MIVLHLQWDVTLVAERLRDFHTPKYQLTFCIRSMGTLWHQRFDATQFHYISPWVIPSISNSPKFAISGALRLQYAPDFAMLGKYESAAQHHTNNHLSND